MDILQDGESDVLRERAQEVPSEMFSSKELLAMVKTLDDALDPKSYGVAIAGPQVGIPYRIFLVRYDRMHPEEEGVVREKELGVFINPEIIKTSRKKVEVAEGCLSVDQMFGTTKRYENVTVAAYDEHGKKFTRGAGGLLAQAFQHEIEHLDGILFTDHAINVERHEY